MVGQGVGALFEIVLSFSLDRLTHLSALSGSAVFYTFWLIHFQSG